MPDDPLALAAAAFLAQVLDLTAEPSLLADDLHLIDDGPTKATYMVQLDSSAGLIAFLLYAFVFAAEEADGPTGRDSFLSALRVFDAIVADDGPGPRAVAHAETNEVGFILATTPDVIAKLNGESPAPILEATAADLLPTTDLVQQRADAAFELLHLLRLANEHATTWLAATEAARQLNPEFPPPLLTPEESALALFMLDSHSIQNLLTTLNTLITTAREQTAEALAKDT